MPDPKKHCLDCGHVFDDDECKHNRWQWLSTDDYSAWGVKIPREWEILPDENGWTMTIRQDGEGERGWIKVREVVHA